MTEPNPYDTAQSWKHYGYLSQSELKKILRNHDRRLEEQREMISGLEYRLSVVNDRLESIENDLVELFNANH